MRCFFSFRLKALNFDVKVYDNYKNEEVLEIIHKGGRLKLGFFSLVMSACYGSITLKGVVQEPQRMCHSEANLVFINITINANVKNNLGPTKNNFDYSSNLTPLKNKKKQKNVRPFAETMECIQS